MGLIKFLKHALYVRHEELLIEADLNKVKESSFKDALDILTIKKEQQDFLLECYRKSNTYELYHENRIKRYFASGCKCFIAMKKDKFIGHIWWGDNKMSFKYCDPALRYVGETFKLKNNVALAVDFFITPEERGSGTAVEFLSKVWITLNKFGYDRSFGLVQPHNRAARWTYKLLGCIDFKTIVVHRIFNYLVLIDKKLYLSPHSLS